jgi:AmmeMemoRadiSam system protein B
VCSVSYLDELDLVIVSSDLSHYYPYDEAVQRDTLAHRAIEQLDIRLMEDHVEACGKTAIFDADGDRSRAQLASEALRLSQLWGHGGG